MRRKFVFAVFGLGCVFCILSSGENSVFGWNAPTHRMIARIAARNQNLPRDLKAFLEDNMHNLELGSVKPDIEDSDDIRAHDVGVAVDRVREIYDEIIKGGDKIASSELALQLGRIAHYIGDIRNPLHTDQDPAENDPDIQAHARYETQAEDILIKSEWLKKPAHIDDIEGYIENIGDESNKYFDWVLEIYEKPGIHTSKIRARTTTFLTNAAQDVSNFYYTIWTDMKKNGVGVASSGGRPTYPKRKPSPRRSAG